MADTHECPFCGCAKIDIVDVTEAPLGFQAACTQCGARGPKYESSDEARKGWNSGTVDVTARIRKREDTSSKDEPRHGGS